MNKRRLGRTDIEISPIGLGCWQFSQGKGLTGSMWAVLDQAAINSVVGTALEGGISWFDTAEAYGGGQSERALATALHDLKVQPGEVVIATKWLPILRTAANIPRTIDTRLTCLQGYPIDLYQIHLPWSCARSGNRMEPPHLRSHWLGWSRTMGTRSWPYRAPRGRSRRVSARRPGVFG